MMAYAYKSLQIYKKILKQQRFFHFFTSIIVFFQDFVQFFLIFLMDNVPNNQVIECCSLHEAKFLHPTIRE